MMRIRTAIAALGVVLLAGSIVAAQAPAGQAPAPGRGEGRGQRAAVPAEPPKNLQVLPKDMPREQVLVIMRNINQALGVQCGYCHIFEGAGNPNNDFASDTKQPKLTARVMMQMVQDINQRLVANIQKPADQLTRVGCATCHRGAAIPKVETPAPAAPPGAGGAPGGAPAQPGR